MIAATILGLYIKIYKVNNNRYIKNRSGQRSSTVIHGLQWIGGLTLAYEYKQEKRVPCKHLSMSTGRRSNNNNIIIIVIFDCRRTVGRAENCARFEFISETFDHLTLGVCDATTAEGDTRAATVRRGFHSLARLFTTR